MFCENCGKKIDDNAVFCNYCGAKVRREGTEPVNKNAQAPNRNAGNENAQTPNRNAVYNKVISDAKKIPIIAIAGAILVVIIIAVLLGRCGGIGKEEVALKDYMEVNFYGYDTYGTADYQFKYDEYQEKITQILSENGTLEDGYPKNPDDCDLIDVLYNIPYSWEMDKVSDLKNGDTVTLSFSSRGNYDFSKIGVAINTESETYEVNSLDPIKEVDPFKDLTVLFSGISPLCTAEFAGGMDGLTYVIEPSEDLALGDTVTVRAKFNGGTDFSEFTKRYGKKLTATEKTYTVENRPRYAASLDDIPDDMKAKMDKVARASIAGFQDNEWLVNVDFSHYTSAYYFDFTGMDHLGYYYRTPKETNRHEAEDYRLYSIYKINVNMVDDVPYSYYTYYCFDDIIILPDGTCTCDLDNYEVGGPKVYLKDVPGTNCAAFSPYYRGYQTVDAIFNEQIAKYSNLYDYESTVHEGSDTESEAPAEGSTE